MIETMSESKKLTEPTLGKVLPVQITTMLISVTAMFIDSLIIGKFLKDDALAAYGLTNPITLFITAFGGMISNGVQVLAGESAGAGDKERLDRIFSTSMIIGLVGSLIVLMGTFIFSRPLAVLLGANSDTLVDLTSDYLKGIAFCFPMIVLVLVIPTFMQLNGTRKHLVVSAFLLIIIDAVFDILNVKVFHGGMLGMALASTFSYLISSVYLFWGFFRKRDYHFKLTFFKNDIVKGIFHFGLLYLTYKLCQVFLSLAINKILSKFGGKDFIAANSIISSINLMTGSFPSGFGSTTTIISSFFFGKKDKQGFRVFVKKVIWLSVIIDVVIALAAIILAPQLTNAFNPESTKVYELAVFGLRLFSVSIVFNTVSYIIKNSSQSVKNVKRAYAICILNDLALPLGFAFIVLAVKGISWIWLCYTIGQLIAMVISLFLIWREKEGWYGK